jgi:hypothetical protein
MGVITKLRTVCRIYRERHEIGLFLRERDSYSKYQFAKQAFADIALADQGAVQENELPLLEELVHEANGMPGPLIEIGTLFGFTTQKIAFWKDPAKKLITVDNYCWNPLGVSPDEHCHLTRRILWYLIKTEQVELLNTSKDDFFKHYQAEEPSLVFIDADHTYEATLSDIRQARRIGSRIICGHDYCDLHPGVIRAVDESGGPARLCGSVWAL